MKSETESQTCPECGKPISAERWNSELPYCECGWVGVARPPNARVSRKSKIMALSVGLSAILSIGGYLFARSFYGSDTMSALWLQAKSTLRLSSEKDDLQLVRICNSYRRYNCSKKVYARMYARDPKNATILGSLALALTKSGDYEQAAKLYDSFFQQGYSSKQVTLGYASNLEGIGHFEEAFNSYFNLALSEPETEESYAGIIRALDKAGRPWEALSVLDVLLDNDPKIDSLVSGPRDELEARLSQEKASPQTVLRSVAFGIDEKHYFPVKIFQAPHYSSYAVDPAARFLTLSTDEAAGCGIKIADDDRKVRLKTAYGRMEGRLVFIPYFYLGPWRIEGVISLIYDQAPLIFGKNTLAFFESAPGQVNGKSLLTVRKR